MRQIINSLRYNDNIMTVRLAMSCLGRNERSAGAILILETLSSLARVSNKRGMNNEVEVGVHTT